MLRVWPAQGAQRSAESTAFLKVDPRKRQVTLYDPAAGPPGSAGPRRGATTTVPKMFAFDAVFPQDAEQVSLGAGPGLSGRRVGPGGSLLLPPWPLGSPPAAGPAPGCFPGKQPPSPGAHGPACLALDVPCACWDHACAVVWVPAGFPMAL